MSALRDHLADELTKRVSQRSLVMWQDDAREYADVAASLCPDGAMFAAFDGSWYALRREVEGLLAGDEPPRLVIYAPASAPAEDPLEEIRAAAGPVFKRRLGTLVKEALKGQLSEQRLAEIAARARTLVEAEAAISGEGEADVRLISVLGASDARTMALRALSGERDEAIAEADAWPAVAELLADQFGGTPAGEGDELRAAVMRQLVLTEIAAAIGGLPETLASAWSAVSAEQRRRTAELLQAFRFDPQLRARYGALAATADEALGLTRNLPWNLGLRSCLATVAVERLAQQEAVRLLAEGTTDEAARLAAERLRISPWVQPGGPAGDDWVVLDRRWRAVAATAELRGSAARCPVPAGASTAALLRWYVAEGWQVDRAHRRFEVARNELTSHGDLEPEFATARAAYDRWLDEAMQASTTAIEADGVDPGSLARQGAIYDTWVRDLDGPVAYVWVDALRYELGVELAEQLRAVAPNVELHAAVTAAPTVTSVGMANLLPGSAAKLALGLDGESLRVTVGGARVASPTDRVALLRAAHGSIVLDRTLDLLAAQGENELRRTIRDARLVLIRSQELDAAGEAGMLNAAWSYFSTVLQLLTNLVARLGQAGVRRVVITADHGFVTLSRGLGPDRAIDPPTGGSGELHRRAWVGRGGTGGGSTLRVPLAATGTPGDLDLIVPRGLAVFRAGGSKQFFHGGLSAQELLVPVVVVDTEPAPSPSTVQVSVAVAGGRITTGAFAATIAFSGDLFTNEVTVRVVAQGAKGRGVVARVVSGDGYDLETGVVHLTRDGTPPVLTFQVTSNLDKDATVQVEVLDARTGVQLGKAEAIVSAKIIVEDDLS